MFRPLGWLIGSVLEPSAEERRRREGERPGGAVSNGPSTAGETRSGDADVTSQLTSLAALKQAGIDADHLDFSCCLDKPIVGGQTGEHLSEMAIGSRRRDDYCASHRRLSSQVDSKYLHSCPFRSRLGA